MIDGISESPVLGRRAGFANPVSGTSVALFRPSAWNKYSANFALTEFSEVRLKWVLRSQCWSLLRVALGYPG